MLLKRQQKRFNSVVSIFLIVSFMLTIFNVITVNNVSAVDYSSYTYFRKMWVNQSYIDSDLVDYPVVIKISDSIGDKCQSNGADIRFTSLDNSTLYPHNIEKWVDGSNRVVWVRIPRVDDTVNTSFYFHYGNSGASALTNYSAVWDSNYVGVFHMNESTGNLKDNSGKLSMVVNGDPVYRNITGVYGGYSISFDGSGDYFNAGDDSDWDFGSNPFTVECWLRSGSDSSRIPVSKKNWNTHGAGWMIWLSTALTYFHYSYATNSKYASYGIDLTNNSWTHIVGRRNGDNLYFNYNYTHNGTNSGVLGLSCSGTYNAKIGDDDSGLGYEWIGAIDEIFVSSVYRNDSWIKGMYYMSTNVDFIVFGKECKLNNNPIISNFVPANGDVFITYPLVSVMLNDSDSSKMNMTFNSNYSGAWVCYQKYVNFSNSTLTWQFPSVLPLNVTCYVRVNVSDGMSNDTETHYFYLVNVSSVSGEEDYSLFVFGFLIGMLALMFIYMPRKKKR